MLFSTFILVVTYVFEALAQWGAWKTVPETTAFGCTAVGFTSTFGKLNYSTWRRETQTSHRDVDTLLDFLAIFPPLAEDLDTGVCSSCLAWP